MNYLKLQQDLLKSALNRDLKDKRFDGFFLKRENDVLVGFDNTAFFSIPYDKLYIDLEKVFYARELQSIEKLLTLIEKDTVPLTYTGNDKEVAFGKRKKGHLLQLQDSHGYDVFINKSLLKYYDFDSLTLYGNGAYHPAVIYEDGLFVGVACPTRVN